MKWLGLLLGSLLVAPAWGQIQVTPPEAERDSPITAVLANPIPEGAQVQGGWDAPTAKTLPAPKGVHVWAPPGKHELSYRGIWLQTTPITLPDGTVVQVLVGFGFIDESATFSVKGDSGPDPPDPPTPGGKWLLMMVYEADRLDNYPEPQRRLLTSRTVRGQLEERGHKLLRVVERSALDQPVDEKWREWFDFARGKTVPGVMLVPDGGGAPRYEPLPATTDALMSLLESL